MKYLDQHFHLKEYLKLYVTRIEQRDDFYDYEKWSTSADYQDFYDFATDFMRDVMAEMIDTSFYMYFFDNKQTKQLPTIYDDAKTAFAERFNGMNIIGVSKSLYEDLIVKCKEKSIILEEINFPFPFTIKDVLNKDVKNYLLMQAQKFLFFHELGHLIQFQNDRFQRAHEGGQYEATFKLSHHVTERDADIIAANLVFQYTISDFHILPQKLRNRDSLEIRIAHTMVAIYILFDSLSNGIRREIYYFQSDHPHTIIRIDHIIRILLEKGNRIPGLEPLDLDRVLNLIFGLISKISEDNSVLKFLKNIVTERSKIEEYTQVILDERSKQQSLGSDRLSQKTEGKEFTYFQEMAIKLGISSDWISGFQ